MAKKILILFLLFSVLYSPYSLTNTFAQEKDSITITTYYPSPYGVYKRMRLHPSGDCATNGFCNSYEEGELCYYSSGTDKTLNVCDGVNWKSALASGAGSRYCITNQGPGWGASTCKAGTYNCDCGSDRLIEKLTSVCSVALPGAEECAAITYACDPGTAEPGGTVFGTCCVCEP